MGDATQAPPPPLQGDDAPRSGPGKDPAPDLAEGGSCACDGAAGRCDAILRSGKARATPCGRRATCELADGRRACGYHRQTFKPRAECCVCLLDLASPRTTRELQCGHAFHKRCIGRWFGRGVLTCPMCRTVCLDALSLSGPMVATRLRRLVQTVPPAPATFFPSYMIAALSTSSIVAALGIRETTRDLLLDLLYRSFTRDAFFGMVRHLRLRA